MALYVRHSRFGYTTQNCIDEILETTYLPVLRQGDRIVDSSMGRSLEENELSSTEPQNIAGDTAGFSDTELGIVEPAVNQVV